MIYFDSAATTLQKPPQVSEAVLYAMKHYSSVGRGGHSAAMGAAELVHACRVEAGALFHAEPEQVVFTMNATHGLNIAIRSLCEPSMTVVISGFEHNAVLRPLRAMGARIVVAGRALFSPESVIEGFRKAIDEGAKLAVCTCCSNVFGYVLPYRQIGNLCKEMGVPLILDASQGAGVLPVFLKDTEAAFIAMPGHKGLYGPQGTGILLCTQGGKPLLYGGTGSNSLDPGMPEELPDRQEAGTHNVCGIAGLLAGLRYIRRRDPDRILAREQRLMTRLIKGLEGDPGVILYRGKDQTGVLSMSFPDRDCQEVAGILARHGIGVRAGLHCAPLAHESAKTLPSGTLRLSLSDFNTREEVQRFLALWKKLL